MLSFSRSDSGLQSLQSPRNETHGFHPETDQGRGLCSRQQGLAVVQTQEGSRHHHRQAVLYQYPTSTCYAARHWQSEANKIELNLPRQTLKAFVIFEFEWCINLD